MNVAFSANKPVTVNYAEQLQELLHANGLGRKEIKERAREYASRITSNASEARNMANNLMKEVEHPVVSEKVFKRLTTALGLAQPA